MKASEMKKLSTAELETKLKDLKAELFNLRFQLAINQLDNPMRVSAVKKDIARVKLFYVRMKSITARMRNGRRFSCER